MIALANILTFLWLAAWAARSVRRLATGSRDSIDVPIVVVFVLCGLPLALDVTLGHPAFFASGFQMAVEDSLTTYVYCAYMALVPLILWTTGRAGRRVRGATDPEDQEEFWVFSERLRPLLLALMVSPLILVLFAPKPWLYLRYGSIMERYGESGPVMDFHNVLGAACTHSVAAACSLLLTRKRIRFLASLVVLSFVFLSVWLQGKRSIIALAIMLLVYVMWRRGILRGWRTAAMVCVAVVLQVTLSMSYQRAFRGEFLDLDSFESVYENVRVDYFRDHTVKMTLFAELHPEVMQILDYRGQSLLFNATMFVPRETWPDKPWPYAVYYTAAALNMSAEYIGWGYTTSWLEEAIANFSWLGVLLGPLAVALVCRIGDSAQAGPVQALSILIAVMMLIVQLPVFASLVAVWVGLVLWSRGDRLRLRIQEVRAAERLRAAGPVQVTAQVVTKRQADGRQSQETP